MKKPIVILLVFSLLSPYLVSAQPDPCQDKEFLRLKDVNINDMTDKEYQYFMMMSEECMDDDDEKKLMLKLKPNHYVQFLLLAAIIYFIYDEVIDGDDQDNDD